MTNEDKYYKPNETLKLPDRDWEVTFGPFMVKDKPMNELPTFLIDDMILELLEAVDHDIAKQYRAEMAEEPEFVEENLQELREIVKSFLWNYTDE